MNYRDFFSRFGGSARTKNVRSATRLPLGKGAVNRDRPIYHLPEPDGLPPEFIRLCPWEMEFLFAVARRARLGIVELGRFNGGSTFLLACANETVPIWTVDIAPQDDRKFLEYCRVHGVGGNVSLIVGDSQHTRYDQIGGIDLLFIDGDHGYEGCLADITNWYASVTEGGLIVFHDCYLPNHKSAVQDAVLDFIRDHAELEIVLSPYIGSSYWRQPFGSLACVRKGRAAVRM